MRTECTRCATPSRPHNSTSASSFASSFALGVAREAEPRGAREEEEEEEEDKEDEEDSEGARRSDSNEAPSALCKFSDARAMRLKSAITGAADEEEASAAEEEEIVEAAEEADADGAVPEAVSRRCNQGGRVGGGGARPP